MPSTPPAAPTPSPLFADSGMPPPLGTDDLEIGCHLFDFLFIARDASTSSLLWAMVLLESNSKVLKKVRAEVVALLSPEFENSIGAEQLREMRYTEAMAQEVVWFRPPATMVPHIADELFPLSSPLSPSSTTWWGVERSVLSPWEKLNDNYHSMIIL